jgi:hypothetical protein
VPRCLDDAERLADPQSTALLHLADGFGVGGDDLVEAAAREAAQ